MVPKDTPFTHVRQAHWSRRERWGEKPSLQAVWSARLGWNLGSAACGLFPSVCIRQWWMSLTYAVTSQCCNRCYATMRPLWGSKPVVGSEGQTRHAETSREDHIVWSTWRRRNVFA
eukprot:3612665-Amphidinium_carterae.1